MSELTATVALACLAQTLSSPTRLKILKLVQDDELCVCELADVLGVSQPAVSQHLAKLRQAGLVTERRMGQMALYQATDLDGKIAPAVREWLEMPLSACRELRGCKPLLSQARARRKELELGMCDAGRQGPR